MNVKNLVIGLVIVLLVVGIGAYAFISMNHANTKIEITANDPSQNGDNITVQLKDNYRKARQEGHKMEEQARAQRAHGGKL